MYEMLKVLQKQIANSIWSDEDLESWVETRWADTPRPISAEVWVLSRKLNHVLMVWHRRRGLVSPGGKVEELELPRHAAERELREETGLDLSVSEWPAYAGIKQFQGNWLPTINLCYWTVASIDSKLSPELAQPAIWMPINDQNRDFHPDDSNRILELAKRIAKSG